MNGSLDRQVRKGVSLRPPSGLAGAAFWLAAAFCVLWLLRLVPGGLGTFFGVLQLAVALALVGCLMPLAVRLVQRRMLWSLRNKLVLTYLLIGLAPVVLVVTLVLISAYIAAGQFAIHLVDTRLQSEADQMDSDVGSRATDMARTLDQHLAPGPLNPAPLTGTSALSGLPRLRLHRDTSAFLNGAPLFAPPSGKTPLGLPPWASELSGREFHGLVLDAGELYLVAMHQQKLNDGRMFTLLSSLPVDTSVMNLIADSLGRARLRPEHTLNDGSDPTAQDLPSSGAPVPPPSPTHGKTGSVSTQWITGGTEPPPLNVADIQVRFLSTVAETDWDTGEHSSIPISVDSRPSLLYRALFGTAIGGIVTTVIRTGLLILCVVFALIELLALRMAISLSRTITASVSDLYQATRRIDQGELQHRIGVTRNDQLAELSRSFNRMTGSLERLLLEQQEKERLQNELSIAQEVQANLFPRQQADLPTLQLHGICRPARTVSGDYYDFLIFHEEADHGVPDRRETGVGIALGDISGKGISAALLMATLHSAVRAYRFASEELVYSESALAGLTASRTETADCGEMFQSPGRILSLLNRHLYRSTQPEKYATLFLAHYQVASATLTYSNAGQLPPLVLGLDGSIRRLDKGGTVVGLMDGMQYEEDRFVMRSGDIVVAYSDGVTEPENDFGDFGEARLMEVVSRYRHEPLHVISAQVMQALDAWIGAEEQPDDITLVLARQV